MSVVRDEELDWFAGLGESITVQRVDGVPLVHAGAPGPVRAGIAFRVGSADERLPERGFTHLVEHLALHGQLSPAEHRNGATGTTITQFAVSGTEQQVVAFLNHVCEALRDFRLERLETERSILKVEAQSRQAGLDDQLLHARYGATGFARGTYRELGSETATADDVLAWARRWFVGGNAVAWITTDHVPEGLDLRLPDGERQTYVCSPGRLVARPMWIAGPTGLAMVESIVPRSPAAVMFADVLTKSLFRQLRIERGLSYTAVAHYEPLDADHARILVFADAANDSTSEMVDALSDAIVALRDGQFHAADVEEARELGRENQRQFALAPDSLIGTAAFGFLFGGEPLHLDDISTRREALTDQDIAAVARAFWDDAIWQTPTAPDRADGVVAMADITYALVEGASYFHTSTHERIVLGDEGMTVVTFDGPVTVLFDDCVLAVQWADGGRVLVGSDAAALTIEPTALPRFREHGLSRLDAAVPPSAVVRLPARPADEIPQFPSSPSGEPGLGAWALVVAVAILLTVGVLVSVAVGRADMIGQVDRYGEPVTARSVGLMWGVCIVLVAAAVAFVWAWIRRIRWVRGQGR